MQPLVSIIIPYYNRPVKIERCINSVLSQVYTNYEIIVVDDCSEIPYNSQNKNVQCLRNDTNLGPGLSRNKGKAIAKGTYIAFLDSDDYWHPDFLKECVIQMELNPSVAMVYTEGTNIDEFERPQIKRRIKSQPTNTILPQILYKGRYWGTGGCLWRHSTIANTNYISTRAWEDYAFDVSVSMVNNSVIYLNKSLIFYDVSGEQKLSKQSETNFIKEKHQSIQFISKALLNGGYKNDEVIKKSITILILLNLVKLLRVNADSTKYIKEHVVSLIAWQNIRFALYVFVVYFMPNKLAFKYLKKLKRHINQDKISFLIN